MVCRENKARSAVMGYTKHLLAQAGYTDHADHEVQSMLHEGRHRYKAYTQPTPLEYVGFLKGLEQKIINDPTISDADKYRPSGGRGSQPGLVTRIREEQERFLTGKTADGKELTTAQMNVGADFAAMARLSQPLARAQEAKQAYVELYARQMGITVDAARSRFRDLSDRPASKRENTRISLDDDWQEKLAVAGITAEQQDAMGQSNQVREALRIMEFERQGQVATYPTKPAFTPENTTQFVSPADIAGKEQCVGGCGQFGHSVANCPNQAEVERARTATERLSAARAAAASSLEGKKAREKLAALPEDWTAEGEVEHDGVTYRLPQYRDKAINALQRTIDEKATSKRKTADITRELKEAQAEAEEASTRLREATGPIPEVSEWVSSVAYCPDTGALKVTTAPYTLKDGTKRPGKTYVRLMPPDEYERMKNSGDFGAQLSSSVFARESVQANASDRYQFHNVDEAKQATRLTHCPTCGKFASFGTGHKCLVPGSRDERADPRYQDQHRHASQREANEDRAALSTLPSPAIAPNQARHIVQQQARVQVPEGHVHMPHPREVDRIIATNNAVAIGRVQASYLGANVTAEAYVWKNPATGERLSRVARMKCSCGEKECRHTRMAATTLARMNGATPTGAAPGGRSMDTSRYAEAASDPFQGDPERLSYNRIRRRRSEGEQKVITRFPSGDARRNFVQAATVNGSPVAEADLPRNWQHTGYGESVDVENAGRVADTLRARLLEHPDSGGIQWSVRLDNHGGIWLQDPSARKASPRAATDPKAAKVMQETFGVTTGGRSQMYVPPTKSWRIEMLDKAFGQDSGVRGARLVASPVDPTI